MFEFKPQVAVEVEIEEEEVEDDYWPLFANVSSFSQDGLVVVSFEDKVFPLEHYSDGPRKLNFSDFLANYSSILNVTYTSNLRNQSSPKVPRLVSWEPVELSM